MLTAENSTKLTRYDIIINMLKTSKIRFVLVTCPDLETAKSLARDALTARFAGCVNVIPNIYSLFVWKDEVTEEEETLLLAKTTEENLDKLESLWLSRHPYDVPEFVVMKASCANEAYEKWIECCVTN